MYLLHPFCITPHTLESPLFYLYIHIELICIIYILGLEDSHTFFGLLEKCSLFIRNMFYHFTKRTHVVLPPLIS